MTANSLRRWAFGLPLLALLSLCSCSRDESVAAKKPATHEYHGIKVVDHYGWLEDANDPDVKKWNAAQYVKARTYLDQIPERNFVTEELTRLYAKTSPNYFGLTWRAGKYFLLKFEPPAQQPVLVSVTTLTNVKSAEVILDPNVFSTNGSITIDWFVPSRDGNLIAVCLS